MRTAGLAMCLLACEVVTLLSACDSSKVDSGSRDGSADRGVANAGTGGANAGAGGSSGGRGGANAGSGGASAGTGGANAGSGGASAGTGGANAGAGGSSVARGGANAGSGGASVGTGGANAGAGGASVGTGSGTAGHGGATAGIGGASAGTGGSGACPACGDHEACWSDAAGSRCVARSVPLPSGFGIDATEVTRGQYAAWLATSPPISGEQGSCTMNRSFLPDVACMAMASVCQGAACATHPQPCIDMCDAAAYCRTLGRRLCPDADWDNACSAAGAFQRPPGENVFGVGLCNDYTAGKTTTVPVGSKTGCQLPADSGYAGVFDMIGNLEEWADNCLNNTDSGWGDICKPRGLPFGQGAAGPICSQSTYANRGAFRATLGFRCCTR